MGSPKFDILKRGSSRYAMEDKLTNIYLLCEKSDIQINDNPTCLVDKESQNMLTTSTCVNQYKEIHPVEKSIYEKVCCKFIIL